MAFATHCQSFHLQLVTSGLTCHPHSEQDRVSYLTSMANLPSDRSPAPSGIRRSSSCRSQHAMQVKIAVAGLTLAVSIVAVRAQNLDNYPPRGANPDIYNTNADGTCPLTGAANPTVSTEKAKAEKTNSKTGGIFPPPATSISALASRQCWHRATIMAAE